MVSLPGIGGMGGSASQLAIVLSLKDKASAKLKNFNKNVKSSKKQMLKMGAAVGVAVAAGVGAKAVQSASDFEKTMSNVSTLVDTNTESMEEMGKQVKEIGKRSPVDLNELGGALYQVRSAGIDASSAMDVLEKSAQLGVTGLGTTEEATNLLTSAFNVFESQGYNADEAANVLFKTVKAGKTTISELSQAFGQVAPLASEMNIDFAELQAATAALTTTGQKASVSQNSLRAAMSNLQKPTKEMEELLKALNVENGEQLVNQYGLVGSFEKLKEASNENNISLSKAFGSVEALNSVLFLTSQEGGETFKGTLGDMKSGEDALTEGFEKQNSTMHAQHQLLKNKLNVALIELGNKIIPLLLKAVEFLTKYVGKMQEGWEGLVAIVDAAKAKFNEIKIEIEYVVHKIKEFIDMVKKIPSNVGEKISGVGSRISGALGFAEGGVVPGPVGAPVPAIVHGGETIIPPGKRLGGVTINITGNTFMSDEETAEKIGDMIMKNLKLQTRYTP